MRSKILMVYPKIGPSGAFVLHAPLGLIYASVELVRNAVDVRVFDARLYPTGWRERLKEMISSGDTLLVGISVMSGTPVRNAVEIGRFVKSVDPGIRVVWGGPHPTFFPRSILEQDWYCDYTVSGYAVESFHALVKTLMKGEEPRSIPGVSYRAPGGIVEVPYDDTRFEHYDYRKIPYQLIGDYSPYGQLDQDKRIFSIYSALGCPYRCSFCSSPARYRNIRERKWVPLAVTEVADHIEYLIGRYGANYIYFIDDDSFVNIGHVEGIIDEIGARRLKVKLGFRGARVNEIKQMSDAFLDKLSAGGTDILHIGAESGSDRILKLMRKDCTAEDIIAANRKLSRHPRITAAYNFMTGLPTETLADVRATRDLVLRLVRENPRCIIFPPNKFRPLPGTELFEMVKEKWDYKLPRTLEEWASMEVEGDFAMPWYPRGMKEFCDMLFITGYFIDNKVAKVTSGGTFFYKILRILNLLYGPIAGFRFRRGFYRILVEYRLYRFVTKLLKNVVPRSAQAARPAAGSV